VARCSGSSDAVLISTRLKFWRKNEDSFIAEPQQSCGATHIELDRRFTRAITGACCDQCSKRREVLRIWGITARLSIIYANIKKPWCSVP